MTIFASIWAGTLTATLRKAVPLIFLVGSERRGQNSSKQTCELQTEPLGNCYAHNVSGKKLTLKHAENLSCRDHSNNIIRFVNVAFYTTQCRLSRLDGAIVGWPHVPREDEHDTMQRTKLKSAKTTETFAIRPAEVSLRAGRCGRGLWLLLFKVW